MKRRLASVFVAIVMAVCFGLEAEAHYHRHDYHFGARQYNAATMLWSSPDSKQEDYTPLSPLSYCAANPIRFIDPTGNNVKIVIGVNTITISAKIYIAGVTDAEIKKYKSILVNTWEKITSYKRGAKKYTVNWAIEVYKIKPKDSSEGRLRRHRGVDNPLPHEFGHNLGLKDKYRGPKVEMGWENNIMGEPAGKGIVEQKNIDKILDYAFKLNEKRGYIQRIISQIFNANSVFIKKVNIE